MAKKTDQNYTLSGRITYRQDESLEGLIVCAFDQDPNTPDNPLGSKSITDAEGSCQIHFSDNDFYEFISPKS
jgi:hypothetical protein